jgi:transposase
VRRHQLTDEQWQVVEPLLPASGVAGRLWVDDRRVINGMLFKGEDRDRVSGSAGTVQVVEDGL